MVGKKYMSDECCNTKIVQVKEEKVSLWSDNKFRWLITSVSIVAIFEVLSLAGIHLPRYISMPFFAVIILAVGYKTIIHGLQALIKLDFKSINLLMVIAVIGAFFLGEYEEAAVVITLFTLGERLEDFGIETSKSALQGLIEKTPKTASVKGKEGKVKVEDIKIDDILVIKPSDMIPMDGQIIKGSSSVDESPITGEPLPKDKHEGDNVFAGTLNMHGYMEVRVSKETKDSTLSKIIELTFEGTKAKADTQKFIEKFSAYYTPTIIVISLLLVIVPTLVFNQPMDKWLREALTLLVIACPCALVISTPVSIYSAIGNASSKGILVKGGKYIEAIGQIKAVAVDKTRTLTYGKPIVSDVIPFGETSREHLLACAAGIEMYSEHPLAVSIVEKAKQENIEPHKIENFQSVMGKGAKAECLVCYDKEHSIGKLKFITEELKVQDDVVNKVEELQRQGKTSMVISSDKEVEGIIAVTDEIKPESKKAVEDLMRLNIAVVMLTGDNITPALAVAKILSITEVKADLLPEDKATQIKELNLKYKSVAMVGDGVNDAPALALSSVGIAMGAAGSDTAIEAASIAILNDRLEFLPFLVQLGRKTISTIKINTSLAVITKLVFIILALAGISSLALAIFADVGVTVVVILNSLRLLKYEPNLKA